MTSYFFGVGMDTGQICIAECDWIFSTTEGGVVARNAIKTEPNIQHEKSCQYK